MMNSIVDNTMTTFMTNLGVRLGGVHEADLYGFMEHGMENGLLMLADHLHPTTLWEGDIDIPCWIERSTTSEYREYLTILGTDTSMLLDYELDQLLSHAMSQDHDNTDTMLVNLFTLIHDARMWVKKTQNTIH